MFPSELEVAKLQSHHPGFDMAEARRFGALYDGGKAFRALIDQFLVKRTIEIQQENSGQVPAGVEPIYAQRKKRAWYIPRGAGLVDWLVAAVHRQEPKIVCKGGTAEQKAFWEGLNDDADGRGMNLPALTRRVMRQIMVQGRGYFGITFPAAEGSVRNPSSLEFALRDYAPLQATDWMCDERGNLTMLRVYTCQTVRKNPWDTTSTMRHTWTFLTADKTAVYVADAENGQLPQYAKLAGAVQPHDFGRIPVFDVRAGAEAHIVSRCYDILVALFNRESSITYLLDLLAFAQLVLKLGNNKSTKDLVSAAEAALLLNADENENAGYINPSPDITRPLFDDEKRLTDSLYQVLQMAAISAATTQTQNPRQAAAAKAMDRDPLVSLLYSFAWPVRDALEELIAAGKKHRGEDDLEIELEGLEGYEDNDETLEDARKAIEPQPRKSDGDAPVDTKSADGTPVVEGGLIPQEQAMNGAQVQALQSLIQSVAAGQLPLESVRQVILAAFPTIPVEMADAMVQSAGKFESKKSDAPPAGSQPADEKPTEDEEDV